MSRYDVDDVFASEKKVTISFYLREDDVFG